MIRRRFLGLAHLVVLAALLPLLPACAATYDHTEITEVGIGDLNEEASSQALSIVVGDVLTANVVPYNTDDNPMVGDVQSEDPGIATVLHTATGGYGFLGTSVGTVHLTIYADGAPVGGLEATVRVQDPAGP